MNGKKSVKKFGRFGRKAVLCHSPMHKGGALTAFQRGDFRPTAILMPLPFLLISWAKIKYLGSKSCIKGVKSSM
jgi:hypothetical protein